MSDDRHGERLARIALCRLTEPGDPRLTGLVAQLGAPRVHEHLANERDLDGMLSDVATRLAGLEPERELDQATRLGIRFVIPGDAEWPAQLHDLEHCGQVQERGGAPVGLWVKGPLRLDQQQDSVAMVGARSATTYGADVAGAIAAEVAAAGLCVVSGAAFGIDNASHRGALAGRGRTVAVLACGVDRVYPAAHRQLLDHLAGHGAVVSELAPGCAPTKHRFLARNRIIAALARGTVVVEAAVRSGALNTANWTDLLSRRLMGVPGPVTSAPSAGVHQLIRTGAASLVTTGAEVLEQLGVAGDHALADPRAAPRARDRLRRRDAQVLDAVPVSSPAAADSIARTAGVGLVDTQAALGRLARDGFAVQTAAGWLLGPAGRG
jgi:DNA processing protein